jgi:hypothetical protein
MERDGSGVSALLGLDGFVVCAQLLDDAAASGGWRWRPPRIGPVPVLWCAGGRPWAAAGGGP